MSASDELSSHRFFRAMVLMGSSLALACGGESIVEGGADGGTGNAKNGGTASGGAGGTGNAGTSGTGTASGGTTGGDTASGGTTQGGTSSGGVGGTAAGVGGVITVTGGASSSGGTGTSPGTGGTIPVAGNTSMGGTGGAGPVVVPNMDCSSDFWSCGDVQQCTNSSDGYTLPENCKCDFSRPTSGVQCSSGRRVCLMATHDQEGNPFPGPVPFQCTCASDATSCSTSCQVAFPDGDGHECTDTIDARLAAPGDPVGPGTSDILCGCSFVFLK
jgi:hypothetical protein